MLNLSSLDKQRLVQQDIDNLLSWEAEINIASEIYSIPEFILAGVLFNETNFRPLQRGGQYGHGQINCRIWLKMLKKHGVAHNCKDLLKPYVSIHASALILSHLTRQNKSKNKGILDWPSVLSYYRHGYKWDKPDMGYYNRVYYFGKNLRSLWQVRKTPWCKI